MPSLTALKNGTTTSISQLPLHRKKSLPDDDPTPTNTVNPALPPIPKSASASSFSSKELPAVPKEKLPPLPRKPSMVPPRREVGSNAREIKTSSSAPQGLRRPAASAGIDTAPAGVASTAVPQSQSQSLRAAPPPPTQNASFLASSSATLTPSSTADADALTPLEDFIPTPDGEGPPSGPGSSDEQVSPYTPLEAEPIAAPLDKLHFSCFQEHRNMPVAQNVWCPVPCMTCHKFDRETRHRCVFCCLRICEGCHQALMKCKNRSLAELMANIDCV